MKTLILPIAGKSTRYKSTRPKWLLTMPDGRLMIEHAIINLDFSNIDRVVVVCLFEHLDKYISSEKLLELLKNMSGRSVEICVLDSQTSSQSETVAIAIQKNEIKGPVFVKDCDNSFAFSWNGTNQVAVLDLNKIDVFDAKGKSYVTLDPLNNVLNIVEKQVVSNTFCCGGYGFESAQKFLDAYLSIESLGEIYISHVIYKMILDGFVFNAGFASNYLDWGTFDQYNKYKSKFVTLFCDVDGVLLKNGSKFSKDGWKTNPIDENLKAISRLQADGFLYLIITSSRPVDEIPYITSILNSYHIKADQFVMGLPHTKRILVNDYAHTNPYPTAISINVERDSESLSHILAGVVK